MGKALGVTGQLILLQKVVALTLAITEEVTVQANVSRTAGNQPNNCKYLLKLDSISPCNIHSDSLILQLPRPSLMVKTKWEHSSTVRGNWW